MLLLFSLRSSKLLTTETSYWVGCVDGQRLFDGIERLRNVLQGFLLDAVGNNGSAAHLYVD